MENFANKRRIQQGEDWNLDILLSQSDKEYIPYIISSERDNPYFVITVASTKFEKNYRYVNSWWLSIKEGVNAIPTFEQTVPYTNSSLETDRPNELTYNDLKNMTGLTDDEMNNYVFQYKLNGKNKFVYVDNQTVLDYECRIIFNLQTEPPKDSGTGNWSGQNYMYQITLVSGELMADTLQNCYISYPELDWPKYNYPDAVADWRTWLSDYPDIQKTLFNFIKHRIPNYFQPDIDWDSPIGIITIPVPILRPTELQVDNNLRVLI